MHRERERKKERERKREKERERERKREREKKIKFHEVVGHASAHYGFFVVAWILFSVFLHVSKE